MHRISIVGTSGSGKTTLAKALSKTLGIPHFELDGLYWLPDWKERPHEEFAALVEEKTGGEEWIMEGNYSRVRDKVWGRATVIIWINLPFRILFTRMFLRIFKRSLTKEALWSGNRETLLKHFFTRDSMLLWVIKTYPRRKREYPVLLQDPRYDHLTRLEFRTQKEVDAFLNDVQRNGLVSKAIAKGSR